MYTTSDFRNGLKIEVEDTPYEIVEFQHFKTGRGGAMIRTKLRNFLTGRMQDITFRSGEKVARPDMETREMQYLYKDTNHLIFMDLTTYDQLHASEATIGEKAGYLKESQIVPVLLYRGQALDVELPASLSFKVVDTDPGVKGDTVSSVTKPATIETGHVIQVPIFIDRDEIIRVDTRTGEYLGRE